MQAMTLSLQQVAFGSDDYRALLAIREEVLRKPLGWVMREKDVATDVDEFHLAAFDQGKPVACVLLRPLSESAVQLRQMAVLDSHRGQQIGAKLVHFAEAVARNKHFTVIETRARKTAEQFYAKLGYTARAEEFEDEHTLKMVKRLA